MNTTWFKFIHKTDKCVLNGSETLCIHCCCMIIICKWAQDLFYVWLTLQHQMQRCCSKSLQSRFHPTPKSYVWKRLVNLTGNASIPQLTHPEKNAHMCDTGLRRCHCGAGFPEYRLIWSQGCTLSLSQVRQSHGPQRGRVTTMAHAKMCDTDLR